MKENYKEELRNYYKQFKKVDNEINEWLEMINKKQEKILDNFDIMHLSIRDYDLPFRKLRFINAVSSFVVKGKVGRRLDLILYYDDIPLGYIQYSSPLLDNKLSEFVKNKYGELDYNLLNAKVVDLSICVPFGMLRKYLTGKLLIFTAMSREIIDRYNKKYKISVEILHTTSIYGKSSMYNRVRNLRYLGNTQGYHSIIPKEWKKWIMETYKKVYPQRQIKKTALSYHLIRLYLHLQKSGIKMPFEIPRHPRGVYVCDVFLPLAENLNYWYNRWFIKRYKRIKFRQTK